MYGCMDIECVQAGKQAGRKRRSQEGREEDRQADVDAWIRACRQAGKQEDRKAGIEIDTKGRKTSSSTDSLPMSSLGGISLNKCQLPKSASIA